MLAQLQVHRVDVRRQGALRPEAVAVGARVLAQLQVHRVDVRRQVVLLPEGDARGVVPTFSGSGPGNSEYCSQ